MKKISGLFFAVMLLTTFCFSCKQAVKVTKKTLNGPVFGSYYSIIYFSSSDMTPQIDSIFKAIDKSLSTYRNDSEIAIWNSGNDTINLSDNFIQIANLASKIHKESDGYFDPTVKTLVEGWGFGNGKPTNLLSDTEVTALMKSVGFDKLKIKERQILKENKEIQLDFNSIAPGFTSDVLANFFLSKNIKNFMIDIGGEIVAHGQNTESKSFWRVGIDNPTKPNERDVVQAISLENESLAVSGNYRKTKVDSLGNRIVHTVNPKTGYAQSSNLLSVTIVTDTCALADGYATSCMAMGVTKCKEFLTKNKKLKALMIYEDDNEFIIEKINNF
ncbi:FAD:protein FMN transferase [Kordia sp. SMS9]|uniref:FAD:protein FMN transferase n=1 Tax=Kordia sp. SMS9 TaxID=2282170 RepID=UPI000E10BF68|nr:FAD:protein FMN transferase [Kordia sp. SMS9]AXG69309.1 FAD:protein FMN transferase [Kordia sp. SMS9]